MFIFVSQVVWMDGFVGVGWLRRALTDIFWRFLWLGWEGIPQGLKPPCFWGEDRGPRLKPWRT